MAVTVSANSFAKRAANKSPNQFSRLSISKSSVTWTGTNITYSGGAIRHFANLTKPVVTH